MFLTKDSKAFHYIVFFKKITSWFLFLFMVIACFSCQNKDDSQLRIATAANMQFVIKPLIEAFETETGISAQAIISSSGKLTAQIKEGAPYDVFVSANMLYPTDLHESGFTQQKPEIYAYGKLILWTITEDLLLDIKALTNDQIKHIALANPRTAPYGMAANEVLQHYDLFESVKPKLVFGESIAQVNQFVNAQAVDIGFTAKSVVLSSYLKDKGFWKELDQAAYSPIAQGIVVLKNRKEMFVEANAFYTFLFSQKAKGILKAYGYE